MVEVVATQVQTYRVRRPNGSEAVVVASDDRNTLEIYGANADRRVWIKRNDMSPEMS
jgi:membrane peptidoglycan carboxypeptidase